MMRRYLFYSTSIYLLVVSCYAAKAQQVSQGLRPSVVVTRGYSVNTTVRAITSKEVKGSQLEADNSINIKLIKPFSPISQAGDLADFQVSPNSSLVQLQGLDHSSLIEFDQGTSLNTLVKTKDNAIPDGTMSTATSVATIVVETELRAQENALSISDSFEEAF